MIINLKIKKLSREMPKLKNENKKVKLRNAQM